MPFLSTQARKKRKTSGAGGGNFSTRQLTTSGTTWSIGPLPMPVPGYAGPMDFIIAGTSSAAGVYWTPDSKGGTMGAGQVIGFTYQALGDETSYTISHTAMWSSSSMLSITINGGANNGKTINVGSAREGNNYGAAGAGIDKSSFNTLPGTLWFNGSCRPYNSTIYYTDNTQYSPAAPASYGPASQSKTYANGTRIVNMRGTNSPGGLSVLTDTGAGIGNWGHSPCLNPSPWSSTPAPGVIIIAYPD